jgi:fructokinase
LLKALRDEGVGVDAIRRLDAPTTLALVGLDPDGVPSYAFYGEGAADRMLPASALEQLQSAQAFHFGSFSMVVEPVASTLRALVEREHARSVIAYDPNVRLHVEPSLECWRAALAWMLPRTHLLKISDEDLRLLFPEADASALAADWLRAGVTLVVVTHGARGASAWTAAYQAQIEAAPVAVVDTVGAGDAFQAALLTALAERGLLTVAGLRSLAPDSIHEVLQFATQAAGITCSRHGADLPQRGELGGD